MVEGAMLPHLRRVLLCAAQLGIVNGKEGLRGLKRVCILVLAKQIEIGQFLLCEKSFNDLLALVDARRHLEQEGKVQMILTQTLDFHLEEEECIHRAQLYIIRKLTRDFCKFCQ